MTQINSWTRYGVTNFVDPLSKRVAEAKDQIERNASDKIANEEQRRKANPDVQRFEAIKGTIDLVGTLAKLRKDKKGSKSETEEDKLSKENYRRFLSTDKSQNTLDSIFKTATQKGEIELRTKNLRKVVRKLKLEKVTEDNRDEHPIKALGSNVYDHEMLDYLLSADASELVRIKENRARAAIEQATATYQDKKLALEQAEGIEDSKTLTNSDAIVEDFRKSIENDLKTLGISADLIASIGGFESIIKQAQTLAGQGGARYNVKRNLEVTKSQQDSYDTARMGLEVNPNSLSYALSNNIRGLETEGMSTAVAKNKQTSLLAMQIDNDSLDAHELAGMQTGWVEHEGGDIIVTEKNKHLYTGFEPSDDPKKPTKLAKGSILLNEGQWKLLNARMKARTQKSIDVAASLRQEGLINAIGMAERRELSTNGRDQALIAFEEAGGDTNSENYKLLSRLDLGLQTDDYYKIESDRLDIKVKQGKVNEIFDNLDSIENTNLRKQWEKKKEEYEAALSNIKSSEDKDHMKFGKSKLVQKYKYGLITGQDIPPGSPRTAQQFIANIKQKIFTEEFFKPGANPTDPSFNQIINERIDFELDQLGWNRTFDDADKGILTPNAMGEFPLLEAFLRGELEMSGGSSSAQTLSELGLIQKKTNSFFFKATAQGANHKERVLNTKGLVVSNGEMIAAARFGWNPKTEKFTFPTDVLIKSEAMGVQPSTAMIMQIRALENSKDKDDEAIVQTFGLTALRETLEEQGEKTDVKLRQILEETEDKNLLTYYERLTLDEWDPEHFIRLSNLEKVLDKTFDNPKYYSEADIQKANEEITKRLKSIGYEDEAIIDLIDQGLAWDQWEQFNPKN